MGYETIAARRCFASLPGGHLSLWCFLPQWLQESSVFSQFLLPCPNPKHFVHWISGVWSNTATLCRSTWMMPALVSLPHTAGDTCSIICCCFSFIAFLLYLMVILHSSSGISVNNSLFCNLTALMMPSSLTSVWTFFFIIKGSLFYTSSTLSLGSFFLICCANIVAFSFVKQPRITPWSFTLQRLSILMPVFGASIAFLILLITSLLVSISSMDVILIECRVLFWGLLRVLVISACVCVNGNS